MKTLHEQETARCICEVAQECNDAERQARGYAGLPVDDGHEYRVLPPTLDVQNNRIVSSWRYHRCTHQEGGWERNTAANRAYAQRVFGALR